MVLEETLESPLDCKEIKPVNPKEISPEYSFEGLMLKLKLQYFGHLIQRTDLFEKTLMLGKIEGRRRSSQQRMRWMDGITNLMDMSLSMFQEMVKESTRNAGDPSLIPGLGRSAGEGIGYPVQYSWASLVAQLVKNRPAMQDT